MLLPFQGLPDTVLNIQLAPAPHVQENALGEVAQDLEWLCGHRLTLDLLLGKPNLVTSFVGVARRYKEHHHSKAMCAFKAMRVRLNSN